MPFFFLHALSKSLWEPCQRFTFGLEGRVALFFLLFVFTMNVRHSGQGRVALFFFFFVLTINVYFRILKYPIYLFFFFLHALSPFGSPASASPLGRRGGWHFLYKFLCLDYINVYFTSTCCAFLFFYFFLHAPLTNMANPVLNALTLTLINRYCAWIKAVVYFSFCR